MSLAIERVVVQIAPADKRRIAAKAKKMDVSLSELMRRASFAYTSDEDDDALGALADAAKKSADNCVHAMDDALSFIKASNQRIAAMEGKLKRNTAKLVGAAL
jgi:hypothetical protein